MQSIGVQMQRTGSECRFREQVHSACAVPRCRVQVQVRSTGGDAGAVQCLVPVPFHTRTASQPLPAWPSHGSDEPQTLSPGSGGRVVQDTGFWLHDILKHSVLTQDIRL